MDKYRRNDDVNDDLGVYNQNEEYLGLTMFSSEGTPAQPTHVFGHTDEERELLERMNKAKLSLSAQELALLDLVVNKGRSIRSASKLLGFSQQMGNKHWKQIREKMQ